MRSNLQSFDWHNWGIATQNYCEFGVSAVVRGGINSNRDAIKQADDSLYAVKQGGRDKVVLEDIRLPEIAEGPSLRLILRDKGL